MRLGRWLGLLLLSCAPAVSDPSAIEPLGASAALEAARARLPSLEPCHPPGVSEPLLCGELPVPEDRSDPEGRQLALHVVVLPAVVVEPPSDPVVFLEGGPGGAATERAAGLVHAGAVRKRDILLVDQRGTGRSAPLDCDLSVTDAAPGELRRMFPSPQLEHCIEHHRSRAVERYGTADLAHDLEAVRRWLGYGPMNLRGGSYGTKAMMTFAQLYPSSVRSLFGIGVDSPLRSNLAERGVSAEDTLAAFSALCARDVSCRALSPDLGRQVEVILDELARSPIRLRVTNLPGRDSAVAVTIHRPWMAETIRLILYYAFTSRALPWALHQIEADGDWEPLVRLGLSLERMFQSSLSYGVLLTVQCSEQLGFDVEAALERNRRSLFGAYRLEQQLDGCARWPHDPAPPLGIAEPVPRDVPALFLSGALDPVTPPRYAEEARRLFPKSRHLVAPTAHHGLYDLEGGWSCVNRLWAEFVASADPEVDDGCLGDLVRPPFLESREQFEVYLAETFS